MKTTSILLLATLLFAGAVGAAESEANSFSHTVSFRPEVYAYEYTEPGVMSTEGYYSGAQLAYTFAVNPDPHAFKNWLDRFYVGVEGRFAYARVDYESYDTGSMNNVNDQIFEGRFLAGFDALFWDRISVGPLLGLGYRYLNNDSGRRQSTTGHWGYERESNYFYIPLGARCSVALTRNITIGSTAELDMFLFGRQYSHLEDVDPSYETIENDQNSGSGYRFSLFYRQQIKWFVLSVEPFYRYWEIDDSDVTQSAGAVWLEPANDTTEVGVRLGVGGTF